MSFSFWSYEDKLPKSIKAIRSPGQPSSRAEALDEKVGRDALLCNWPQVALVHQSKTHIPGAVYDAKHWSCVSRAEQAKVLKLKTPLTL